MMIEPLDSLDEIVVLLEGAGLSADDLCEASPARFYGVRRQGILAAVIGLELHGEVGLLRSLAVDPEWRGQGLASRLIGFIESQALAQGVQSLYLLSSTAVPYFREQGYAMAIRASAPPAIQATAQFAGPHPMGEALMVKTLRLLA